MKTLEADKKSPNTYIHDFLLGFVVFMCGAIVMIYEVVGSRVLAPTLGTSTYVWTSLIGVILGSLSIGYWLGGRLADRNGKVEILSGCIFMAAAIICITNFAKEHILGIIEMNLIDIRLASLLASVILFTPASILLGIVSPYSVKLKSYDHSRIGVTVGNLYAASTVGSIAGTFLSGYFLIPWLGTSRILILLVIVLTLLSLLLLPLRCNAEKIMMLTIIVVFFAVGNSLAKDYGLDRTIADIDTEYGRIQIFDFTPNFSRDQIRVMKINGTLHSGIYLSKDDLLFDYYKYFRLVSHFKPDTAKALLIGGGAYVYPLDFLKQFPDADLDVVEIDTQLTEIAHKYFRFNKSSRMKIFNEDGRTFINRSRNRYDAIFLDVFNSYYSIPYHLTTIEAVRRIYAMLNTNGVVLMNLISPFENGKINFLGMEIAIYRKIFPQVYIFPIPSNRYNQYQNFLLIAIKGNNTPSFESSNPELNSYLSNVSNNMKFAVSPVLTDDFAPVDYYMFDPLIAASVNPQ